MKKLFNIVIASAAMLPLVLKNRTFRFGNYIGIDTGYDHYRRNVL